MAGIATRRVPVSVDSMFKSLKEVEQAFVDKLKESALTVKDAKVLGMRPFTAQDIATKFKDLPAYRAGFEIPYFDLKGKRTKFYRFRYLEYGHHKGFAALVQANLKRLRYAQPTGTVNEIYLPPNFDWETYAKDADKPLVITEGELKAACATKFGIPTLGLGGVWSWRSAKHRMPMLPMFGEFNLKDRRTYICYDSDAATNPKVVQAENALAEALLTNYSAIPFIIRIPSPGDGKKMGLDDFLVANDCDTDVFFDQLLPNAIEFQAAQELLKLNEEVLYVQDPGVIVRLDNMQRLSYRNFVDHAYATRVYNETVISGENTRLVEKSAPKEWIKWPHRAEVPRITYAPGVDRITERGELNMWKGWKCEPKAGSIKPWKQLLDYLFDYAPDSRVWFEQWLACPLQHPGIKLFTAPVLWGRIHGTGKSMIGYSMFEIYGANATEIGERELHASYNDWAESKQFVMADEILGGDKRDSADRMKSMITQKKLLINQKYVPVYSVPDCINYYFTSNHPDAFFLEDSDRRFFVHEVRNGPMEESFYKNYCRWLYEEGGAAALFHHLLTLDISSFNPSAPAPLTESKKEMIEDTRSDLSMWVNGIKDDPEHTLAVAGKPVTRALWTAAELHTLYDPQGTGRVTVNGIARELKRAGFRKVANGQGVRTADGQVKLYALRDMERLLKLDTKKIAEVYAAERSNGNGKRHVKF